jgi:two-component system, cell cycle response regulator
MKILVLNNDVPERMVIQKTALAAGHEIVSAGTSEAAMQRLREGEIRFVIADRATTDMEEKQFIRQVRAARPPYYIYILLLTPKLQEPDLSTAGAGADDFLHKPIVPAELKSRLHVGERIIHLGDRLVQAKDALETTAMFDALTGVLNYRAFLAMAKGELERARRAQSPLSLIALGIDNFTSIHEQFGQAVGDDVLTVVARGIREKSRPYDGVGRHEGEIFLIVLPGVISQDAERITERILTGILNTEISLMDGTQVDVKLSAGVASSAHISAATEIEMLIAKAVEALGLARRAGETQAATVFV